MGLKELSQGRSDILKIDPRNLHIKEGWNSRDFTNPENIEHIDALAKSIAWGGVKEPLTVYWEDDKAYISDGECRYRGTMKAIADGSNIQTVPCKIEERYANDADRLLLQDLRNSGKPFNQLEKAKHYKRLLDYGMQQSEIATRLGISASRISQILGLLTLPEQVKQMVAAGQVSPTKAQEVVRDNNPVKATQILQDAVVMAQQDGTKVKPAHVQAATSGQNNAGVEAVVRGNIRTIMKGAFESCDIDPNDEDDFVIIKMPRPVWEVVSDELKL